MSETVAKVKRALAGHAAGARRDHLLFTVLTVLLTPFAVVGLVALVIAVMVVELRLTADAHGIAVGLVLFHAVMLAVAIFRAKDPSKVLAQPLPLGGAALAGLFCAALSFGTHLETSAPRVFFSAQILLVCIGLACLGRVYENREDYELWSLGQVLASPVDDETHLALGCLVGIPGFLIDSYSEIFASRWLWSGLTDPELGAAARVLEAMARNDATDGEKALAAAGSRVLRALEDMKLIRRAKGGVVLSGKGGDLVRAAVR